MHLKKINLKNKVALVTGAGKGIGKACAIALAEAGANLIIISRTQKDLDKVSKVIKKFRSKCTYYACDVTNYNQIKNIINEQKKIDILINNAGTNIPEHFTKVQKKNMEYLVKLNTISTFHLAQLCTLKMLETRNLHKIFEGFKALTAIDFKLNEGERHAIIGPNGAGKTTFFNLITGHTQPSSGEIRYKGNLISGLKPYTIVKLGLARSFQRTAASLAAVASSCSLAFRCSSDSC